MRPMLQLGISVLISGIFSLLLVVDHALALPATPPSLNLSSVQSSPSFLSFPPTESQVAACDDHMGVVNYDDCDAAIALFPRDPRGRPVLRNFYTDPPDESSTMPNVRLPLEQTYGRYPQSGWSLMLLTEYPGSCTAQVLLATNFNDVPHDQSSWNNLIGPLRIVLRQCARIKGTGGVIVRNGAYFRHSSFPCYGSLLISHLL